MSQQLRPESKHRVLLGFYTLHTVVGSGTFGKVYHATHNLTMQPVAIKIAKKRNLDSDSLNRLRLEFKALKMLRHPNLIQLVEFIETKQYCYLVMEYCPDGDLCYQLARKIPFLRFSEDEARYVFCQLVEVVGFIHGRGYTHRDIKPANILLSQGKIKLTDFNLVSHPLQRVNGCLETSCGTAHYAAPEIMKGKSYIGTGVDIWSMGVTLYELLVGTVPFVGENNSDLAQHIMEDQPRLPDFLSADVCHLIRGCLQKDPDDRIKMHEICCHSWFLSGNLQAPRIPNMSQPFALEEHIVNELARILTCRIDDLHFHLMKQPNDYYMSSYTIMSHLMNSPTIANLPRFNVNHLPKLKRATIENAGGIMMQQQQQQHHHQQQQQQQPSLPLPINTALAQKSRATRYSVRACPSASSVASARHVAFIRQTLSYKKPTIKMLHHTLSTRSPLSLTDATAIQNRFHDLDLNDNSDVTLHSSENLNDSLLISSSNAMKVSSQLQSQCVRYATSSPNLSFIFNEEDNQGICDVHLTENNPTTSLSLQHTDKEMMNEDMNRSLSVNDLDQVETTPLSQEQVKLALGDRLNRFFNKKPEGIDENCHRPKHFSLNIFSRIKQRLPFFPLNVETCRSTLNVSLSAMSQSPRWSACETPCHGNSQRDLMSSLEKDKEDQDNIMNYRHCSSMNISSSTYSKSSSTDAKVDSLCGQQANKVQHIYPLKKDLRTMSQVEDMVVCHPLLSIKEALTRLCNELDRLPGFDYKIKRNLIRIRHYEKSTSGSPNWCILLELCYLSHQKSALCFRFKRNQPTNNLHHFQTCFQALLNADLKSPPVAILKI